MDTDRLVFAQTVEGLLRGIGNDLTPELKAKVLGAGINVDKLEPAVSAEVWAKTLEVCAAHLYPVETREVALRKVGARSMSGFFDTLVGKGLRAMLRVIGPMRALQRIDRNMRSADNFVKGRFTQLGPTSAELWVNDSNGVPEYLAGVLETAGQLIGAKGCRAAVDDSAPPATTYRIEWDP